MTSLSDLPIRDDLRGKLPYGAPMIDVPVTLNVNENTHPVPAEVRESILASISGVLERVNRYPDREFVGLRSALADYVSFREAGSVGVEQIWAANGSNEVLQHVLQAFGGPGRSVLGFPPTYSMHPIIAESTGTQWVTSARDASYEISPATAVAAIEAHAPNLVFFCAPNNPTGTGVALETIEAAYDATDGIVLVDEAYIEFAPPELDLPIDTSNPRVIRMRTFSKAHGMAGARVGYAVAHKAIIGGYNKIRNHFGMSRISLAGAQASLQDTEFVQCVVDQVDEGRHEYYAMAQSLGLAAIPSATNFVAIDVGNGDRARAVLKALEARGVFARMPAVEPMDRCIRVSVGLPQERAAFREAFEAVLEEI